MSTVERKEYQETKVLRTVSPVRNTRSSTQNLVEFDNNLDYLLEDLQSSVSRPGSSLGNPYRESSKTVINSLESGRSNSLNRITHVKSANPVTEYSSDDAYSYTSPDGTRSVKSYKKESYSYKTSGDSIPTEKVRMQNNINQLDSLLDDLQQVKHTSTERGSYNNIGVTPSLQNGTSKVASSKKTVQRELHYGDTPRPSSRTQTLERSSRESSVTRDIQYSSEGTYGDIKSVRHSSPTRSNTSTLTKQTKVTNVHSYPVEVVETTTPDINPEILANLDPHLLPSGNTKVTTTIKTYTYEIPGEGGSYPTNLSAIDNEKYIYSPNQSQTTPSKSFVYSKVENNRSQNTINYTQEPSWKDQIYKETTINKTDNYIQPYQKPNPPAGTSDKTLIKETVTTRNYQPRYSPELHPPQVGKDTYLYNETTTTRNYDYSDDRSKYRPPSREPPVQHTYIMKETHNTNNANYGSKYISDNRSYPRDTEIFDPKHPPYANGRANEPVNISYHYKSQSTTSNNYKGYPPGEESQPLLQPKPFPTDTEFDGPPKKVDDLMATIGREPPNSPYNAGFNAHEAELIQQKKIESLKQQQEFDERKKDQKNLPPTKNVSGPPVYYPPGHEMFAKKEESGAWRAEGAMARESGKYKYEAESKSKSKQSSGAAIVPVCLPLCCGLPCTIL